MMLSDLYLIPHHVSVTKFAELCDLSRKHVSSIIHGSAAITPETAERFARVLGTTAQFWLNAQNAVDLWDAEQRLRGWEPKKTLAFA
jgi:addiction module HigA family antidote